MPIRLLFLLSNASLAARWLFTAIAGDGLGTDFGLGRPLFNEGYLLLTWAYMPATLILSWRLPPLLRPVLAGYLANAAFLLGVGMLMADAHWSGRDASIGLLLRDAPAIVAASVGMVAADFAWTRMREAAVVFDSAIFLDALLWLAPAALLIKLMFTESFLDAAAVSNIGGPYFSLAVLLILADKLERWIEFERRTLVVVVSVFLAVSTIAAVVKPAIHYPFNERRTSPPIDLGSRNIEPKKEV